MCHRFFFQPRTYVCRVRRESASFNEERIEMKKTLKEQLIDRTKENIERHRRERDEAWQSWLDTGGLFEALKHPVLLIKPSDRTYEQLQQITMRYTIPNLRGNSDDQT